MENVDGNNKSFVKILSPTYTAIMVSDLGKTGHKVVSLVHKLSCGCHQEWATIRKCDFFACGVISKHIDRVLVPLFANKVLDYKDLNQYRVNKSWIKLQLANHPEETQRLSQVIGKNLPHKQYHQDGGDDTTEVVVNSPPLRECEYHHDGGTNEDNLHKHRGISSVKDTIEENKYNSDRYTIADKNSSNESFIKPKSKKGIQAQELFQRLEPNHPGSFKYYLKAVWHVDYGLLCQFASEIEQDKSILKKDRGKVFVNKVESYLSKGEKRDSI